jgi:hypothetical protein
MVELVDIIAEEDREGAESFAYPGGSLSLRREVFAVTRHF